MGLRNNYETAPYDIAKQGGLEPRQPLLRRIYETVRDLCEGLGEVSAESQDRAAKYLAQRPLPLPA